MNASSGALFRTNTFFTKQKWDTLHYIDKLYIDCNNNVSRMLNLFDILYADDTVIMAENECGNLNLLNEYCNCNGLRVNIRKTKIIIINLWSLQGLGQGFVICPHLNLVVWILIWLMTMFIWVFVLIGMAHSLKQKTPS